MNTDYASVEYNNINKCIQNLSIFKNKLEFIECIYSTSKRAIYKVKDKENEAVAFCLLIYYLYFQNSRGHNESSLPHSPTPPCILKSN